MNNIILDTNAFIYLMNIEKGNTNTLCIDGKKVDDRALCELCRNANYLFVTGQTLYELLWQSVEKTGNIDEFAVYYDAIAKYRRIYKVNFSVLNDADGQFDLQLFEKQYRDRTINVGYYVEEKREYECQKLGFLIFNLFASALLTIIDCYNAEYNEEYLDTIKTLIHSRLEGISQNYYLHPGTKNELYDKEIDELIGFAWDVSIDLLRDVGSNNGIIIPKIKYNNDGTDYIHRFYCRLKKPFNNIFTIFDNNLSDISKNLKENGEPEESVLFLQRLCHRCIYDGAKLRKNDGMDYSIITCLAKNTIINETGNQIDLANTYSLTFDKNLYHFSKESGVLYNKKIYDQLLK